MELTERFSRLHSRFARIEARACDEQLRGKIAVRDREGKMDLDFIVEQAGKAKEVCLTANRAMLSRTSGAWLFGWQPYVLGKFANQFEDALGISLERRVEQ